MQNKAVFDGILWSERDTETTLSLGNRISRKMGKQVPRWLTEVLYWAFPGLGPRYTIDWRVLTWGSYLDKLDSPLLLYHYHTQNISGARCVSFPHQATSNSLIFCRTSGCPTIKLNSDIIHSKLAQQVKGLVPQGCSYFRCQSQVPGCHLYFQDQSAFN